MLCDRRSGERSVEHRSAEAFSVRSAEWVVELFAMELDEEGAMGWRLYRPIALAPTRLPHLFAPQNRCAYEVDLFERRGRVWALERWRVRAPERSGALTLALSHPRHSTAHIQIKVAAPLSDSKRWIFTPEGVCPSLLPLSPLPREPTPSQLKPTPPQLEPMLPQLVPLLACGAGASTRLRQLGMNLPPLCPKDPMQTMFTAMPLQRSMSKST